MATATALFAHEMPTTGLGLVLMQYIKQVRRTGIVAMALRGTQAKLTGVRAGKQDSQEALTVAQLAKDAAQAAASEAADVAAAAAAAAEGESAPAEGSAEAAQEEE